MMREPVVFLHLPKTGGTTLINLLRVALPRAYIISGADGFRAFMQLPQQDRDAAQLVAGHMPYGVHQFIDRRCRHVVFLRNPIDRLISAYYFVRRVPAHPMYARIKAGMTLAEYARDTLVNDNGQTRRLARYGFTEVLNVDPYWWIKIPIGAVQKSHFDQALETLALCDFVGFTETFDRDVATLFVRLGLPMPASIPNDNATEDRPRVTEIDAEAMSNILERNQFDLKLYGEARQTYGGT